MNQVDKLKKLYGNNNVNTLSNGNYYVTMDDGTELFIPKDMDEFTNIYGYIPGDGGAEKDADRIRKMMKGNNAPNYVVAISPNSQDSTNILEQATKAIKNSEKQVKGVVVEGFSLGARQTMVTLSDYLKKHPEQAKSSAIIMTDGWIKDYYTRDDLQNLRDNQVPIVYISGATQLTEDEKDNKVETLTTQLAQAGFNAYGVKSHDMGHNGFNHDVQVNGFALFIFGDKDKSGNRNVDTENKPDYEFYKYDPKSGTVKPFFDMAKDDDFTLLACIQISDNLFLSLEDVNAELFTKADEFKIKSSLSSAATNNKVLLDLKDLSYTKGCKVRAKETFVLNNINAIRGDISSSNFLSNLKVQTYRGGTGIPAIISSNIDKYFGVIGTLLRNIEKESRAAISIADAYMQFDHYLALQMEGKGKVGTIKTGDIPADLDPPKEEPKDDGKKKSPKTPGTKPPTDPDKTKDPEKPDEEEKKKEPKHTVKVEDDKITQKTDDGSILELDYKDGKVTSITYKYEYESEAKAQEEVYELIKKYDGCDYISGIYPKGNKIEVVFNEKLLSKIDIEKLKELIEKNNDNEKLKLEDLILSFIKKK